MPELALAPIPHKRSDFVTEPAANRGNNLRELLGWPKPVKARCQQVLQASRSGSRCTRARIDRRQRAYELFHK